METTKLTVEYLAAGLIICLALAVLGASIFPVESQEVVAWVIQAKDIPSAYTLFLAAIATAVVYVIGILSEHFGLFSFEWMLNLIRRKRYFRYIQAYKNQLKHSPLKSLINEGSSKTVITHTYGDMRFYVISKSTSLSEEIASQINRFRLIRVTFWVEIIFLAAVIVQMTHGSSGWLVAALIFLFLILLINVYAIWDRFNRYLRSVERAYLILSMQLDQL